MKNRKNWTYSDCNLHSLINSNGKFITYGDTDDTNKAHIKKGYVDYNGKSHLFLTLGCSTRLKFREREALNSLMSYCIEAGYETTVFF